MAQAFVDRYMEDDVIYKVIGLAQDNVRFIITLFVTSIVAFYSGKVYGVKTQSVISGLKERYENIEAQKKKLRKQLAFLGSTDKLIKKFIILLFLGQVGLIVNIIFNRGFDYTVFLVNSLSRNLILLLTVSLIVILIIRKGLRRFRANKLQFLTTIHSGMDEIADKLLKSLGPELTTILKLKLQTTKSVNTTTRETQTIKEVKPKPEVVINPAEVTELKKNIAGLEALLQSKVMVIEQEEVAQAILRKDLHRHKVFLQKLKSFDWCDKCLQHAEQEGEEEEEGEEQIKEQIEDNGESGAPEKTHPANKDEVEAAKGSEEQKKEESSANNVEQKPVVEKGDCSNECLKKYFEMATTVINEFNHEEREINEMKKQYKLARSHTTLS